MGNKHIKIFERLGATAAHLSMLFIMVIPFGFVIGPLAVWTLAKREKGFIEAHARESLNFNISFLIYSLFILFLISILPAQEPLPELSA